MGLLKQFGTNLKAEKEGVELTFEPNADGTVPTLVVSRTFIQSPEYRRVFERVSKPYKNQMDHGVLDEETDIFIAARVYSEVCVKSWRNVRLPLDFAGIGLGDTNEAASDSGSFDIPFTVDNCTSMFCAIPDLFRDCAAKSATADSYREGIIEGIAKN
jgi:hypothetical protein